MTSHQIRISTVETMAPVSAKDRKRFEELFKKLDINEDGTIDIRELRKALRGDRDASGRARRIMRKADSDLDYVLNLEEFINYMQKHEKKLRIVFSSIDKNKDGKVQASEVRSALINLGVNITNEECERLIRRLDRNKDLEIDWNEWRDYFNLYPEETLPDIVDVWRHPPLIDIGEQLTCPPELQSGVTWRYLLAGGIAGAVSRTLTAPLDRLKIMCQVYGRQTERSLYAGLKRMIDEGGWKSLWRGNGTSGMKIAPESAIRFAAYEEMKKWLKGDEADQITIPERFAVGSASGAVAQTFIYPLEVIKTRLAIGTRGQYRGIGDCAIKIIKRDGIFSLYRGYVPNLIGILPYAGIDLTIYETLKLMYQLRESRSSNNVDISVVVLCSTISSTCGQLASYPLQLVRTRIQAQATHDAKNGFYSLLKSIIRTEGPRGLFHGIVPNLIKALPAASISYVIYEKVKTALGADEDDDDD